MTAPNTERAMRAAELAHRGFRVFPVHSVTDSGSCTCGNPACGSIGKHPVASGWQQSATADYEDAFSAWVENPTANIGVLTGGPNGVVVLDVDDRHGGSDSLAKIEAEHGPLPATWTVTTGNGRHLYFRGDSTPIRNGAALLPGLDIRGEGGFVVAPGSKHGNGSVYQWATDPNAVTLSPIPSFLVELTKRGRTPEVSLPADGEKIPEGSRNSALASLAGRMRQKGLTAAEIEAALLVANRDRCNPPLPDAEVRTIAASVARYEPGESVSGGTASPDEVRADRFTSIALSAEDFLEHDYPMPRPLVAGGVVSAGDLVFLYGRPGLGKTWAMLQLALSLARGTPWFGLETTNGGVRVGILELELHARWLQDRLRTVAGAEGVPASIQIVARPDLQGNVNLLDASDWASLAHWCRSASLDVLVIDALSRAHEVDENQSVDFAPVLRNLDRLRHETGTTVLPIHHEPKGPGDKMGARDDMDALRGTSRLASDANTLIRLARWGEGDRQQLALRFPKVNNAPTPAPVYLAQREDGALEVTEPIENRAKEKKEHNSGRIVERVRNAGDAGVPVELLIEETGLSKATVHRHLKDIRAEKVGPDKAPRYRLRGELGGVN